MEQNYATVALCVAGIKESQVNRTSTRKLTVSQQHFKSLHIC